MIDPLYSPPRTVFGDLVAGLTRTSGPTYEPISLAQAKAQLRVEHNLEDALISAAIIAARGWVEEYLGRTLVETEWTLVLHDFPAGPIRLLRPPILAVDSVKYDDADGVEQTLAAEDFHAVATGWGARLYPAPGESWPSTQLGRAGAVRVVYSAGYGSPDAAGDPGNAVPGPIKAALLLLTAHLYTTREPVSVGHVVQPLPMGIEFLLAPYRVIGTP